jgi:hypothetical protein
MKVINSLSGLPHAPLPGVPKHAAIFVTIWLFVTLGFAVWFGKLLYGRHRTWQEFRIIWVGTILLTV